MTGQHFSTAPVQAWIWRCLRTEAAVLSENARPQGPAFNPRTGPRSLRATSRRPKPMSGRAVNGRRSKCCSRICWAHPLVERLEQRLLRSSVPGPQVIEGEFGAELEAGGAVVPHAFVVQHRGSHIAFVQGEGARERGSILERLRGALAKRGKHRVRRVPEQTDTALHPGFERVSIAEAPLRGTNDRPSQSEQIASAGAPP